MKSARQFKIRSAFVTAFAGCLIVTSSFAQTTFKKLKEFPTEAVDQVSIDRLGDFYLILKSGAIRKYDPEGNFMSEFPNAEKNPVTLLETWNPLRVFLYNRDKSDVTLLDRHLEVQEHIPVDAVWAIEPVLASPGITNTIWVLDKADWSIKLVDPKTKGVVREATINVPAGNHDFIYLREYQSLLFLIDKNSGLWVLNTLGKPVRQVDVKGLSYVAFLGEEFYYRDGGKLKFLDIYTEDTHEVAIDPTARFVFVTDERMIVIFDDKVEVREFKE